MRARAAAPRLVEPVLVRLREQSVGLVDDEEAHVLQSETRRALEMLDEASGRADEHVDAAEPARGNAFRVAPVGVGVAPVGVLGVAVGGVALERGVGGCDNATRRRARARSGAQRTQ